MPIQPELRRANALETGTAALEVYEQGYLVDMCGPTRWQDRIERYDPSTTETLWALPDLNADCVDQAVMRARTAQPAWENTSGAEKGALFFKCADALEKRADEIGELLAMETGKALTTECKGEVALMLSIFRYFAGLGHEIKGRSIQAGPTLLGFTTHHPWGVVGGIVPWNVPLMFMAYKTVTPMMAGNTVVIKVPEEASATLCLCFEILRHILPENTVHFLTGRGKSCGAAIVAHQDIDKISFTGSVETGRTVLGTAARDLRPVTLELGGKSPMVILDDCSLDKAIDGIFGSMRFTRAGQSCTAASRIYVPVAQLDEYVDALSDKLDSLVIGDPLHDETQCGPVVTKRQMSEINKDIDRAKQDELEVKRFGERRLSERHNGWYVDPHVVINPDINHPISQREIFGPVTTVSGYSSIDEVTNLSNATSFGLSASVWGQDITRCLRLAHDFRAGIVQVNQNAVMLPGFSYGGVGISGQGKESSLEAMLETYMYEKTNIVNFG